MCTIIQSVFCSGTFNISLFLLFRSLAMTTKISTYDVTELGDYRSLHFGKDVGHDLLTVKNDSHIITFMPRGRMCNRMFEFASMLGIAEKNNLSPRLQKWNGVQECFNMATSSADADIPQNAIKDFQPQDLRFGEDAFHIGAKYNRLQGQMQSWKYFSHVDDVIREEFTFKGNVLKKADEFLRRVRGNSTGVTFISLQIRRTDFIKGYENMINPITTGYIERAMSLFRNTFSNIKFIVTSDEIGWCKKNLNRTLGDIYFSEQTTPCQDLAILSRCNHSIITAGSTFGWWGAYLANGHTTYYKGWLKNGGWGPLKFVEEDVFLPRWTELQR